MRTPQDWLAEQVTARPDDFAPDEMAAPLAWIASVQADALEAAAKCAEGDVTDAPVVRNIGTLIARDIRALIPRA